jgi:hypothetical protein
MLSWNLSFTKRCAIAVLPTAEERGMKTLKQVGGGGSKEVIRKDEK